MDKNCGEAAYFKDKFIKFFESPSNGGHVDKKVGLPFIYVRILISYNL